MFTNTVSNLRLIAAVFLFFCFGSITRADPFVPTFEKLSPGVWAAVRNDNPRFPVMGTATFVISGAGVVVFDGGGSDKMAGRIIDKIKSLTPLPVTHVAISHWHGDHNFGIHRYLEEYPNVQVIAHTFTHSVMTGTRINYIEDNRTFVPEFRKTLEDRLASGKGEDGKPLPTFLQARYQQMLADADMVHEDFGKVKVTLPTITFDDKLTVRSGNRVIEFIYLGDGNTAGDIMMWLPEEKIISAGDTVVHPVPYAFNMPPRKWASTLRAVIALDYKILVPGHGDIQRDTEYVDLLIETSEGIADQRDKMLSDGISEEDAEKALDYSPYEERYTGGDPYLAYFYQAWFKGPFSKAAFKALKGIPMVTPDR